MLKIVEEIEDYTHLHFTEEEKLMEGLNYPDLADHKVMHENFKSTNKMGSGLLS
ncbi:MAG: hypothetical protein HY786_05535 [Deltaproteobacteria bacterium]|nr:hypothetical protein [Deltaproteobacteria bacterium]